MKTSVSTVKVHHGPLGGTHAWQEVSIRDDSGQLKHRLLRLILKRQNGTTLVPLRLVKELAEDYVHRLMQYEGRMYDLILATNAHVHEQQLMEDIAWVIGLVEEELGGQILFSGDINWQTTNTSRRPRRVTALECEYYTAELLDCRKRLKIFERMVCRDENSCLREIAYLSEENVRLAEELEATTAELQELKYRLGHWISQLIRRNRTQDEYHVELECRFAERERQLEKEIAALEEQLDDSIRDGNLLAMQNVELGIKLKSLRLDGYIPVFKAMDVARRYAR